MRRALFAAGVATTLVAAVAVAQTITNGPLGSAPNIGAGIGTSLDLSGSLRAGGAASNTGQVQINAAGTTAAQVTGYSGSSYIWGMGRGGTDGGGIDIEANNVRFRCNAGGVVDAGTECGRFEGDATYGYFAVKGAGATTFLYTDATETSTGTQNNLPFKLLSNNAPVLSVDGKVHVRAHGTAPALTSCGTGSPAITGTDTAGIVTMGTSATGCIITFNMTYTAAPFCVVTWIATPLASQSYVTAADAITLTQTSASGNKAQYICIGQAGG